MTVPFNQLIDITSIDDTATHELADEVIEAACSLASNANNGGVADQIAFLRNIAKWSEDDIVDLLDRLGIEYTMTTFRIFDVDENLTADRIFRVGVPADEVPTDEDEITDMLNDVYMSGDLINQANKFREVTDYTEVTEEG